MGDVTKLLPAAQEQKQERKGTKHLKSSEGFCCTLKPTPLTCSEREERAKFNGLFLANTGKTTATRGSTRTRAAGDGATALPHLPELVELGEVGHGQQVDVDHAEELQVLEV